MISIITPTHNPKWINRTWESIKSQDCNNWEWIICPNNGATINKKLFADKRVKIVQVPDGIAGVGAIKKFAFSQGRGEILLELDHDDELCSGALTKVTEAFADSAVGFVYSNAARIGSNLLFDSTYGWTFDYTPEGYVVPLSFEPSPASLSRIWFAPDHLRAWRREVYKKLGGHNASLTVCDDHELLCRTYLVTKMVHIPEALYRSYLTGENTQINPECNAEIQRKTVAIGDAVLPSLALRWATMNNLRRIDLGGAFDCPQEYESLDLRDASILWDIEREGRLPFADSSIGVIRAHDFLEHIKDQRMMMREIHRVLVDGGWLLSFTPSTDGRGAWQDPTHVSFWNENSFWYWTRPAQAKYIHNTDVHFQEFTLKTDFPSEWHKSANIPYVYANLSAVKSGNRRPHYNPW